MLRHILINILMIIGVFILSFFPLFIYSHLDTLVVNSTYLPFQKAGFLGYLPFNSIEILLVSFCFAFGVIPIIYKYSRKKSKILNLIIWLILTSVLLLIARYIGQYSYMFGQQIFSGMSESTIFLPFILISVSVSTFLLGLIFSFTTKLKIKLTTNFLFSLIGGLLAVILSYSLGGLELVGTWGGIPIFKMITLITWNVIMSQLLLFYTIFYSKN